MAVRLNGSRMVSSNKQLHAPSFSEGSPYSSLHNISIGLGLENRNSNHDVSVESKSAEVEDKTKKTVKPWVARNKDTSKIGNQIRVKLPRISDYDKDRKYIAQAPPRVLLRLERVAGTDELEITNNKYMTTLATKIDVEENQFWQKRVTQRKKNEQQRQRQLIFDGIMEPPPETHAIHSHPIFRVNRILRQIGKLNYDNADTYIPPPIEVTEPFEEQNRTGYLFGSHKNHYLNIARRKTSSPVQTPSPTEQELLDQMLRKPNFSSTRSIPDKTQSRTNHNEKEKMDHPAEPETKTIAELLRRPSLTQAPRYFGLDATKLKHNFEIQTPQHVQNLFEFKDKSSEMYDYSSDLLRSYRRTQFKTDDFCSKVHRKLFN